MNKASKQPNNNPQWSLHNLFMHVGSSQTFKQICNIIWGQYLGELSFFFFFIQSTESRFIVDNVKQIIWLFYIYSFVTYYIYFIVSNKEHCLKIILALWCILKRLLTMWQINEWKSFFPTLLFYLPNGNTRSAAY